MAQTLKRLSAMRETQVWSLGQEDPLEKEMVTHSSTLAWKIPWTEETGRLQSVGSQRVGHDWATLLYLLMSLLWLPGGSVGKESASSVGDPGSIPGSGRFPGEGTDNPPQYSRLENPLDRGAWWAGVHAVAESDTTEWVGTHNDSSRDDFPVYYFKEQE